MAIAARHTGAFEHVPNDSWLALHPRPDAGQRPAGLVERDGLGRGLGIERLMSQHYALLTQQSQYRALTQTVAPGEFRRRDVLLLGASKFRHALGPQPLDSLMWWFDDDGTDYRLQTA
jgi:hypothetical protein